MLWTVPRRDHSLSSVCESLRASRGRPQIVIRYPTMANPEHESLFHDLLANNRGPGYGISVVAAAPDLSSFEVDLRFLAGRTYCCGEPGCHLPRNTKWLVQLAAAKSLSLPSSTVVHWHCIVEEGAQFECMKSLGLPLASKTYSFEATSGGRAVG